MLSVFPLGSTGLEGTSWLASSSFFPIFSFPPVSYTVRLCSGRLWEVNSALWCRKVPSTEALGEGCLSLCGPSLKWEEAHLLPAASVDIWQERNTQFENSCFFYTLLRRLPDACFCCAKNGGQWEQQLLTLSSSFLLGSSHYRNVIFLYLLAL